MMSSEMRNAGCTTILAVAGLLSGCSAGVGGIDNALFSNASKVYIFTQDEKNEMTPEGTIQTMAFSESDIRARFKNANNKPSGVVNYCGAGLSPLVQSRRNSALAAIDGVCGGKGQYAVRREGGGYIAPTHVGSVNIGASCNRPMSIIFRCNGAQPKPDLRK